MIVRAWIHRYRETRPRLVCCLVVILPLSTRRPLTCPITSFPHLSVLLIFPPAPHSLITVPDNCSLPLCNCQFVPFVLSGSLGFPDSRVFFSPGTQVLSFFIKTPFCSVPWVPVCLLCLSPVPLGCCWPLPVTTGVRESSVVNFCICVAETQHVAWTICNYCQGKWANHDILLWHSVQV